MTIKDWNINLDIRVTIVSSELTYRMNYASTAATTTSNTNRPSSLSHLTLLPGDSILFSTPRRRPSRLQQGESMQFLLRAPITGEFTAIKGTTVEKPSKGDRLTPELTMNEIFSNIKLYTTIWLGNFNGDQDLERQYYPLKIYPTEW